MREVSIYGNIGSSIPPQGSNTAEWIDAGGKIGGNLQKLENELLSAYERNDTAAISKLQFQYQAAQRIFELFSTLLKSLHELLMSLIRKLAL